MIVPVEAALELLRHFDNPRFAERPEGFDERPAATRFTKLLARRSDLQLRSCLGVMARRPGRLALRQARIPTGATETGADIAVLVSNFGSLAMYALENAGAYDDAERELLMSERDRDRVESALANSGYVALAEDVLWEPYDGANQYLLDLYARARYRPTWFIRFFSYI
jgi:hypothetical protein